MACFGDVDSNIADDLVKAEVVTESITFTDLSSDFSRCLLHSVTMIEENTTSRQILSYLLRVVTVVDQSATSGSEELPQKSGYEAWRLLKFEYEPSTGSRHVAMINNLLKNQLESLEEFRKWVNVVETYEASSGELVSENMKIAVAIQAVPRNP